MAQTTINSISQMKTSIETINGYITNYKSTVQKIMDTGLEIDAMWDGEASNKFASILKSDQAKFNAMEMLLKEYTEKLSQIVTDYMQAENKAVEILNTRR